MLYKSPAFLYIKKQTVGFFDYAGREKQNIVVGGIAL
jgi:hypothetical protein